ncbi:MAG: elongation factor P [Cytophagales bacterium]|nr:elongation factor P [Cytophagales bacterium]MDW8384220.1 elongation factor P [Flammeovirgaceae bacterium]
MATTADFKPGLCIEFNNDIYTILEFQHVKPGKGPAFVRTKLKSLTNGKIIDNTFTAGVKITTARVVTRPHQYTYKDEMGYHFMDSETFEEVIVEESKIEAHDLLKEGQQVDVMIHDEKGVVLQVILPPYVVLRVTYTEPGVKGDTATSAMKPATVETGARIQVPLFIDNNELIKVNTSTYTYAERVKE